MTPRDGITTLTDAQLEAMLDRAAQRGAIAALHAVGLHDEQAGHDIRDLRDILTALREAKRAVWTQVLKMIVTVLAVAMAGGLLAMVLKYQGGSGQ